MTEPASRRPNEVTGANDVERVGFAGKLRVVLHHRPGAAELLFANVDVHSNLQDIADGVLCAASALGIPDVSS